MAMTRLRTRYPLGMSETGLPYYSSLTGTSGAALCPDLLRYEQIGEADGLRGRVVRAFFWLLRAWPPGRG